MFIKIQVALARYHWTVDIIRTRRSRACARYQKRSKYFCNNPSILKILFSSLLIFHLLRGSAPHSNLPEFIIFPLPPSVIIVVVFWLAIVVIWLVISIWFVVVVILVRRNSPDPVHHDSLTRNGPARHSDFVYQSHDHLTQGTSLGTCSRSVLQNDYGRGWRPCEDLLLAIFTSLNFTV